jgi:hypothetical protein
MALGFDDANVIGILESRLEERFEASWLNGVAFKNDNSNSVDETYGFFGGFPRMREWIGARQLQVIAQKSYTIRNRKFESSLSVPRDMMRRDKTKLLNAHVSRYASGVPLQHWEDLAIELLVANGNCYDGTPFLGTTHRWKAADTAQKNSITNSDVDALNVADPVSPTPAEMASAIIGLIGWLLTFTDDQGRDVNGDAQEFTVVVNTVPHWIALGQALKSEKLAGGADNPINGLNIGGMKFKPKFIRRWTGTNKVRVLRTDGDLAPIMLQDEKAMQYEVLGEGSDYAVLNDAHLYALNCSRGAGYGLWEDAIEGTLS